VKLRLRNHRRTWTNEDDDILRALLADDVSVARIALKLKRTRHGILYRAHVLDLSVAQKRKAKGK
jgi:hypothetical protein